ncbi:MAG TPA: condensation domain-containing protein, partial [Pyrinomonadaceae bacterium]
MNNPANTAVLSAEEKRELLAELFRKQARESKTYPLSFAQQRLWFLDQLEPEGNSYRSMTGARLTGMLDLMALERTLNEIVARHEVLRSRIEMVGGEPVQVIESVQELRLKRVDLTEMRAGERDAEAEQLVREELERPFDLGQGPLWRATLIALSESEHVLLFVIHHIISDGWSMGVLMKELAVLYNAYVAGEESPLAELPIQYADYAAWQREWLQGAVLERQLEYWRKQLGGAAPVLELPLDRARPAIHTVQGGQVRFELSGALKESLLSLSRAEGVTLFMTLLAAFKALLYRYTGQRDISVGTPIAGRQQLETEGLIGLFINTLVLRTEVSGEESFRELVRREREVALGAYAHQDIPFEKLVEELRPVRQMSHTPLFQVMFVLQNSELPEMKLSGLALTPIEFPSETVNFDLALAMEETASGFHMDMHYNTDLFEEATIRRMLGNFNILMQGIVANPNERICDVPLLAHEERRQLLEQWNDTEVNYASAKCLHELIEEQVARTPASAAVRFDTEELSYEELNQRANQLAAQLRALGVGPDVVVGICMERSVEMVVGL